MTYEVECNGAYHNIECESYNVDATGTLTFVDEDNNTVACFAAGYWHVFYSRDEGDS